MSSNAVFQRILAVAVLLMAAAAMTEPVTNPVFAARAQAAYAQAEKDFLADTNASAAARNLARTSFDSADLATNDTQRAEFARRGMAVCRQWLAREPKSAPAHYYLAMNLGELAQAEAPSLAAYKLVHEVEREFKAAAELDIHFDYAGPARNLGELYFQAPGWPLSVGSKHKAVEWLERAAAVAPAYPENLLNLAEAQVKWSDHKLFAATMKNLDVLWPAARTNFTGEAWERSWLDWNTRRVALQAEIQRAQSRRP